MTCSGQFFTQQVFLPLSKTSESSKNEDSILLTSPSPSVDSPAVSVGGMSIEDIVSRVLESTKLRALIASISSENAVKNQATTEEINLLVK